MMCRERTACTRRGLLSPVFTRVNKLRGIEMTLRNVPGYVIITAHCSHLPSGDGCQGGLSASDS